MGDKIKDELMKWRWTRIEELKSFGCAEFWENHEFCELDEFLASPSASGYLVEPREIVTFIDYFLPGWMVDSFLVVWYCAALRAGELLHCVTTGLRLRLITCCPPDKLPVFMSDYAIGWADMFWVDVCFGFEKLKGWKVEELKSWQVIQSQSQRSESQRVLAFE